MVRQALPLCPLMPRRKRRKEVTGRNAGKELLMPTSESPVVNVEVQTPTECPFCNQVEKGRLPKESNFCPDCGSRLRGNCPECESKSSPSFASFCVHCGFRFDRTEQ